MGERSTKKKNGGTAIIKSGAKLERGKPWMGGAIGLKGGVSFTST